MFFIAALFYSAALGGKNNAARIYPMTDRPAYPGVCKLCGGTFNKATINRHLRSCLEKQEPAPPAGKPAQPTFVIAAAGKYEPGYWLTVETPASAQLQELDQYLRDIWLECCGHLSAFTIQGTDFQLNTGMVDAMWLDFFGPSRPTKSMKVKLSNVLQPGLAFEHRYDFGTTTELKLKVVAQRIRAEQRKGIRLLARNNPPDIRCAKCGQPATWVCSQCIYEGPQAWVCDQCARKHRCGEDMLLPVVNSPRVGMCGYTGPAED